MKPFLLILAVIQLASFHCFATSLTDSVITALEYHPSIKAAIADKDAASHNTDIARGGFLPQITASVSSGHQQANNTTIRGFQNDSNGSYVNTAELSVRQLIYDAGNTASQVNAAEQEYSAANHRLNTRIQDVILAATRAHLEVLRQQELLKLARSNVTSHEEYVTDIRDKAELGIVTRTDAHQAEARLALAYSNLLEEEESLLTSSARYQEIVGIYPDNLTAASAVITSLHDQQQAIDLALQKHPAVAEASSQTRAAGARYKQSVAALYPELYFEISSSVRDASATTELSARNGQSHDTFAGITLEWDLYRGGSDQARQKTAAAEKIASEELLRLVHRDLREDIRTIWQQRSKLKERLPLLETYASATDKVLEDYIDQFSVNRRSLLDLLDRQVEAFRASSELINASYTLTILNYELLHAAGQLQEHF